MSIYTGKICPYCKCELKENDDVVVCSACEMPHHRDCWVENQGCTTFGCQGTINNAGNGTVFSSSSEFVFENSTATATQYCTHCGAANAANVKFCTSCGLPFGQSQPAYAPVQQPAPAPVYVAAQQPVYSQTPYTPQQPQAYAPQQPVYPSQPYGVQQEPYGVNPYGTQPQQPAYQTPTYGAQTPSYNANPYYSQPNPDTANPYNQVPGYQGAAQNYQMPIDSDVVQLVGRKSEYYIPKFQSLKSNMKKASWNWPAFLITPFWLIYRKMYVYGAAWLGGVLLLNLIDTSIASICSWIGYFVFGILGNYFYMNHLEKDAAELKTMQEPYRSEFFNKHRDVNTTAAILSAIGYVILYMLILG